MSVQENKALVQRWFEALNASDIEALTALYTEETEVWTAGDTSISGTRRAAELMALAGEVLALFPEGLQFEVLSLTAEEDRVAAEAVSRGRHISGQLYQNRYHFLITVSAGHIVQVKEYMDTQHMKDVLLQGDPGHQPMEETA